MEKSRYEEPARVVRSHQIRWGWTLRGHFSPALLAAGTVKKLLYRASLDNYLMGLKSLVRKGKAHPVLTMLLQLDGQIREDLKTLGLKRVSKQVSISDLLNGDTEQPQGETRQ